VTRRVLLTGGSGQVGQALRALDWPKDVALVAPDRAELDLADPEGVIRHLASAKYDAILSVGAYTAVDRAESERELAHRVNAQCPANLATYAELAYAPLIHLSTDYVFDGSGAKPWREDDPVGPLQVYGATKEMGEQFVRNAPRHVILRTSWVVSATGANFVKTMLRLGAERDELKVVADQFGAPTHAGDLAEAIRTILIQHLDDDDLAPTGTFHICNAGETSWHGFAERIFARAAQDGRKTPRLHAIPTSDYPTPARRPLNSRLDQTKIARDFAIGLRPWQEASDDIVAALLARADG
jgi:dTDP-4-dehydrorhamnose reductase